MMYCFPFACFASIIEYVNMENQMPREMLCADFSIEMYIKGQHAGLRSLFHQTAVL